MSTVVIIGAGLAGLTLALALHQQGIQCIVYESRPAPLNIGGAVMLSPNALRVLHALGLYDSIKPKGFNFDVLHYRDVSGNLLETYEFGSQEKYGFQALRIYRHVLIDALVAELEARAVPVRFGHKFSHVVEDGPGAVTLAMADGATRAAGLLVGADGIHSRVRRHLYPDLEPRFTGMAGVTAAVPAALAGLPEDLHIPATVVSPRGAFVVAPQEPDGSELLIGKQRRIPEEEARLRLAGWEKTRESREDAVRFLQEGNEHFPGWVRRAAGGASPDKVNVWPFFVVPRLARWASATRRVVVLGDAAHAIPPSAGQGINQAFEDAYVLALLLGRAADISSQEEALGFWQSYRQGRVDKILELNEQIDLRRMPVDDAVVGTGSGVVREEFDLEWLYKPDFKGVVDEWVMKQQQQQQQQQQQH